MSTSVGVLPIHFYLPVRLDRRGHNAMEYIPIITAILVALIFVFTIVLLFGFYKRGKLSVQALQDVVILEIIALIGIVFIILS